LPSAIENMADGNSDIGFARLCFVQQFDKRHTKVLKLSALADISGGVLKIWKDMDHRKCKMRHD